MSFAIKGLLALCWLFLIPTAAGIPFVQKKRNFRLADCFLAGYLFLFALAELLTLPLLAAKASLQVLVLCYGVLALLAALIGLIFFQKSFSVKKNTEAIHTQAARLGRVSPFFWCALILIAVQLCVVTLYAHFDADDAFYVATAVTSVETDSIFTINPYTGAAYKTLPSRYVLSPFPVFLALVSQLSGGLHPAIMAHTVFPPVFLILCYVILYQFSKKWFTDSHKRGIFLFIAAVLNSFTYYSAYNAGNFQMIRIWQGKALLAGALLPLLFYLCLTNLLEETAEYLWYLLLMANVSCCLLSSMGIMLAPLMQGIFVVLSFFRFRNLKKCAAGLFCTLPSVILGVVYLML